LPGERATISDWANHLSTVFPEVRLKRYLEMRGADNGPIPRICALPALWAGVLYNQVSLDAAWDMVKDWTAEEREKLRADVAKLGLKAQIRGRSVRDLAREMLSLARVGLTQRMQLDFMGDDETSFLDPLDDIAEYGETPAEALLKLYHGEWNGSVDPIFKLLAY
jgi:glutamate--cysteine ligase